MPEGSFPPHDDETLRDVLKLAKEHYRDEVDSNGSLDPAFESFLQQLTNYATGEDQIWAEPQSLLMRASSVWHLADKRQQDESKINLRIENGDAWKERRLVLDIVTDDKPFLVDSVSAALSEAGKFVSFFANAVVDIHRTQTGQRTHSAKCALKRESIVHAEMDPPVNDDEVSALRDELEAVLNDVAAAVRDWEPMRARLASTIAHLERSRIPDVKIDEHREAIEFLKWLWDNQFAFVGYRRFECEIDGENVDITHSGDEDLGILRDQDRRIIGDSSLDTDGTPQAVKSFLCSNEPLIIAKANFKSLVHRRVHLDYVGVKTYSVNGKVTGEDRFIGLFTSDAYIRPARDIPVVRSKIRDVIDGTEFTPGGFNEKALINILETYPRDEIFQIDPETLRETSLGILRLYKRPRAKLFLRRDRFNRFVSALVFIPRDRFNSDVRKKIGDYLAATFDGSVQRFSPSFGDAALVRVHFIIQTYDGAPQGPGLAALTTHIRMLCRQWNDDMLDAMRRANAGAVSAQMYKKYEDAFDAAYRERISASESLSDIDAIEQLANETGLVRVFRRTNDNNSVLRIKIYRRGDPFPLSDLIPTIEHLGLSVVQEDGYRIKPAGGGDYWLHDFQTTHAKGRAINVDEVGSAIEDAMLTVLSGRTEDDGFNALVVTAGINWREAWVLRAVAKFLVQSEFAYSQAYMVDALLRHPEIAHALITVFHARFNPAGSSDPDQRLQETHAAECVVRESLNEVSSLADDRIFRRFLDLFAATLRTSYFQRDANGDFKPYIAIKIASGSLKELPEPTPYREIFVCGPRVDGIHLRFGPVARGGLRWSDRPEDFRTEVLGLVKAQRVKNAVIVPNGSKGGFFPKQLPENGDRNAIYEEGREAYKLFISALLDLTDNLNDGMMERPDNCVCWDDPDPYLVVAADKGTALFSDTANEISTGRNFWLGDAFASGGSAGYDHKAMGITARGAWEAVKRHFRELGKDIQTETFTAAGVGDMSGDVFGNGMLLSKQTQLVAAFDHRDIFLDPTPDAATSFEERQRLFDMPRSSWQDYNKDLISKGGGVFSRSSKYIELSDEIRQALNIEEHSLTPAGLIKAILKAPLELFWLGGIGTYFKSAEEENWRVGDRANDQVRIDAIDIGAQVIGEGANLGLTQRARIEFARRGGRVNTDAIDNSAGVDSSDHEVNIKILLKSAIEKNDLKAADRNDLLADMTDAVAEHVLRHNYEQTRALSVMTMLAPQDLDVHARFMRTLERLGGLNREVEDLPDADEIAALRQAGIGLSRPELAVLLAYGKLWLFDELIGTDAPDDREFEKELLAYFPSRLANLTDAMKGHPLRREIIATRIANDMLDTCGISFLQRFIETNGTDIETLARCYEVSRSIFDLRSFAEAIDALDNKAPATIQSELYTQASELLREQVFYLAGQPSARQLIARAGITSVIDFYVERVRSLKASLGSVLSEDALSQMEQTAASWRNKGTSESLADEAASMPFLHDALDIIDTASTLGVGDADAAAVYFAVGELFQVDTVRERAHNNPPQDHFDKIAMRKVVDDLATRQRNLTSAIINGSKNDEAQPSRDWARSILTDWTESNQPRFDAFSNSVSELEISGPTSLGKYAIYLHAIDQLINA